MNELLNWLAGMHFELTKFVLDGSFQGVLQLKVRNANPMHPQEFSKESSKGSLCGVRVTSKLPNDMKKYEEMPLMAAFR